MNVVVPPDILNAEDESITGEGGQIQLVCTATGVPEPEVRIHTQNLNAFHLTSPTIE